MRPITISLNPSYWCNFRCNFCYLTPEQLADKTKIDTSDLKRLVQEIQDHQFQIEHVDIYGGEIALLAPDYLEEIDEIFLKAGDPSINVVTNLSLLHPYFLKEHVQLSVSFDFDVREKHLQVLQNIIRTNKEISILMLASPELMQKDVDQMIHTFNQIQNIKSVEIKPYSTNQANHFSSPFKDYEDFVKSWLESPISKRFEFVNRSEIVKSLERTRNAFSDDHIYITPEAKFAVLEFDHNDHEFFLGLNSISEYERWVEKERARVKQNSFCQSCQFQGHCLTEHYRDVRTLEHSCNGFKNLLDWATARKI